MPILLPLKVNIRNTKKTEYLKRCACDFRVLVFLREKIKTFKENITEGEGAG